MEDIKKKKAPQIIFSPTIRLFVSNQLSHLPYFIPGIIMGKRSQEHYKLPSILPSSIPMPWQEASRPQKHEKFVQHSEHYT